jgi:class 3 adenylate cyclase
MSADQGGYQVKRANLDEVEQERRFTHGTAALARVGSVLVGRAVLEPGWSWSGDVKPLVGTASCQIHHLHLQLSGRFAVRMDDGTEHEFRANDIMDIPPGHDARVVGDEPVVLLDISGNVTDFARPAERSRFLATMLFTDIVSSTQLAASLGDARWRQLLEEHNRLVRTHLERFGGREIDTAGDGFLATFDSAGAGLRAALAIRDAVRELNLEVRAGVHTGEIERVGDDVRGIAVHAAARIMAAAQPSEVLTSAVTRALCEGSALHFADRGSHEMKGLPAPMELYAVSPT